MLKETSSLKGVSFYVKIQYQKLIDCIVFQNRTTLVKMKKL